jgi:hypothetical protein
MMATITPSFDQIPVYGECGIVKAGRLEYAIEPGELFQTNLLENDGHAYLTYGPESASEPLPGIVVHSRDIFVDTNSIPYNPNISPNTMQPVTRTLEVTYVNSPELIGTISITLAVYSPSPDIKTNNFGYSANPISIHTAPVDLSQIISIWNDGTGEEQWSLSVAESNSSGWVSFSQPNGNATCDRVKTNVYVNFLLSKFQPSDENVSATIYLKKTVDNSIIGQWTFNFTLSGVYLSPPNLIVNLKKTKTQRQTVEIRSTTAWPLDLTLLTPPKPWYNVANFSQSVRTAFTSPGIAYIYIDCSYDIVGDYNDTAVFQINQRGVYGPEGIVATLELSINLLVSSDSLSSVDAGPDITVLPGEFTRSGQATTTSDTIVSNWETIGDNIQFTTNDNVLSVTFPPLTGEAEYKDYVFKYSVNCSSCEPSYLEDNCVIRVANFIVSSFSLVPDTIDIDLSDPTSQTVTLSTIIVPDNVVIKKHEWSDSINNPDKMISDSQKNSSTVTLSGWRIPGKYKISCLITTAVGQFLAHSDINVIGEYSSTIIGSRQSFPDEDDIYNVEYFINTNDGLIIPNEDSGYTIDTIQNLPYTSHRQCVNPSICTAKNNRLCGSGEQTFYIAYQSFNINKWEIRLRQFRLSDHSPEQPMYEYPYSYSGIAHDFEITTLDTVSFESQDIDVSNSKKYRINVNSIVEYAFGSAVPTVLYTHTSELENIRVNESTGKIYFSTKPFVDGAYYTANIFSADISNILGTKTEIEEITEDYDTFRLSNIRLSQNYIYWMYRKSDSEYYLMRKLNTALSTKEFYKNIGTVDIPSSGEQFSIDVDYSDNTVFIRSYFDAGCKLSKIKFSFEIEPEVIDLSETLSFSLTELTEICVDYRNKNLYLSDPYREKITRIDYSANSQQDRVKSTEIIKVLKTDDSYIYWIENPSDYDIKRAPLYFELPTPEVYKYSPQNMYVIKFFDELGEQSYVTRIVYNLLVYDDYKAVKTDKYGYYKDANITITFSGDLSYYWYSDKTVFEFTDSLPISDGSNLTNLPFDLHSTKPIYISKPIFGDLITAGLVLVPNEGSIQFQKDKFGYCGTEVLSDYIVAKSNGNCLNPKIVCNNDNNLIIAYEDTESTKNQIKIVATGDLGKITLNGPSGSYISNFFSYTDFIFSHTISGQTLYQTIVDGNDYVETLDGSVENTTQKTIEYTHNKISGETLSINQRPDLIVDKNDVIHITWQSNRDNYWEIYYANSENFFNPIRLTKHTSISSMPSIAINDDGNVFVAFHDDRFKNKQIFIVYNPQKRILPLFQQNEYLASYDNDYSHYVNNLEIPVSNTFDSAFRIHVFLKFFDNRLMAGIPVLTVSTRDNPDLFTSENETSISGGIDNGVYVEANDTVYILMIGNSELSTLKKNQTYFVKIEYLYPDTLVEVLDTHLSYSYTMGYSQTETRWICSGNGYSDTRVTYSSGDAISPEIKTKQSGKAILIWNDFRDRVNILGASFDLRETTDLRSSGGSWFDYNYNILDGKRFSFVLDQFDRQSIVYEKTKSYGTKTLVNTNYLGYKSCETAPLESITEVAQSTECDYSSITTNTIISDPYIGSQYVKLIKISEDDVDYYTRSTSGQKIAVVSKCTIKLELTGTPEVVAYRIKNEDQSSFSNWYPFNPTIGRFYTEIDHNISKNSGTKEVCIQVATYSGITVSFSVLAIADYSSPNYNVALSLENSALPLYENVFVVSTGEGETIDVYVYIAVPDNIAADIESGKINKPYFDFIQQGLNDQYGILTEKTTNSPKLPEGVEISGVLYSGNIKIYKHDGKYNSDGISQIKVHLGNSCISTGNIISSRQTKDIFNYFGKTQIEEIAEDVFSEYRNSQTGQIGIVPDFSTDDQETVYSNKYSIRFNREDNYIKISHTENMPIWSRNGYSISFWVKHPSVNGINIFSESGLIAGSRFVFYCGVGSDKLTILLPDSVGTIKTSSIAVFDNEWHHICWIDNNGTTALYIDGIRDGTDFDYVSDETWGENNLYTVLGGILDSTGLIPSSTMTGGYIDEFAAWNKPLLPMDVKTIYNDGIPNNLSSFSNSMIVWLRMGEKTRWRNAILTTADESGNDNYGSFYNLSGNDITTEIPNS